MGQQVQRRLAAVIAADVVGYTRLMRLDEEGTIKTWWSYRQTIIDPIIDEFSGRIVKLTGDGFLAEFTSATNAVLAAYNIQRRVELRIAEVPEPQRMMFRIGVNLGDIFWDEEDIYGDDVNIAARLEGIADPGSVLISQSVFDQVKRTAQLTFENSGQQALKNLPEPVQTYRVVGELSHHSFVSGDPDQLVHQKPRQRIPNSLVVLPFSVLGEDPEQHYFAEGFTDDLITELSRFGGLFLTTRNASLALQDKPLDLSELGQQLGVAYCLEGSIRRLGDRIRITTRLINSVTGDQVWAEKYDSVFDKLFEVQDELAKSIVSTVVGRIEHETLVAARKKKPADMFAYECFLRGLEYHRLGGVTREAAEKALYWFNMAIEKDPEYSRAHAWKACALDGLAAWTQADYYDEELGSVTRALDLDENDAETHRIMGSICLSNQEFDKTEYHFQRALALNPNSAWILGRIGELYNFLGEAEKALEYHKRAIALDPLLPTYCREIEATAHYILGNYRETVKVVSQLLHKSRRACLYQVAALTHLSDPSALAKAVEELLAITADFPVQTLLQMESYRDQEIPRQLSDDLIKAGVLNP
ncbi:adenylate/guanylate cyclase domain-containing protein [Motiliproteus coralliicola]|nr:adenylate/guanylate cyclase domain-containing protein [Motiliproteus coralliicola]